MRIAIDARKLRDYGIGTYVRNLLRHLSRLDHDDRVRPALPCGGLATWRRRSAAISAAVTERASPATRSGSSSGFRSTLRRERADLFHAPHYVLPPLTPCRSVVTIHDCIHLRFPQYLPSRLGYAYARGSLWAATHRSDRILTVSEASKSDILDYFNVPEQKIDVIYNAIDERFNEPPPEDDVERVRERYQLNDPFVLYAGNIKPHKNLERLIEAFHMLRRRGVRARQAAHHRRRDLEVRDAAARRPPPEAPQARALLRIRSRSDPRRLYRLAAVFVFPSLYEGFGLPPLEAMASGTPVITSNVSSLPEVVGDAAVLDRSVRSGSDRRRDAACAVGRGAPAAARRARAGPRAALLVGALDAPGPRDLRRRSCPGD